MAAIAREPGLRTMPRPRSRRLPRLGRSLRNSKIIKRLRGRLQSWPKPVVENMVVDGDAACVQFHGEGGVGKDGAKFDMQYCWVIRLRDGLIAHVTGYYDSVKMTALFRD